MLSLPVLAFTASEKDEVVKSKTVFRSPTVTTQNSETELILDGDDDAVSLLQEKEMDNLGGKHKSPLLLVPILIAGIIGEVIGCMCYSI